MTNDEHRFRPCEIEELDDPVSLINEPVPPDNVAVLIQPKTRPLHAVLIENLNSIQALISRLERGVNVPSRGRETVRELFVQSRRQLKTLQECLQLDELE